MVNKLVAVLSLLVCGYALAAESPAASGASAVKPAVHRFLVERSFAPGALAGLDAATKRKVNRNNASVGVRWVESYATADKTKTYCIYTGPSEEAVRKAAALNSLPVDRITEVPVTLRPK